MAVVQPPKGNKRDIETREREKKKRSSSNQGDTKVHFLTSAKRLSAHLFPSLSFYHLFAG